jgi:hypothetical protein
MKSQIFFEEDEEFETAAEYHRLAAKHHLLAAEVDDEGDNETNARHAYLAYRHQLNGVQYAEIAAMNNDNLKDDLLFQCLIKPLR